MNAERRSCLRSFAGLSNWRDSTCTTGTSGEAGAADEREAPPNKRMQLTKLSAAPWPA